MASNQCLTTLLHALVFRFFARWRRHLWTSSSQYATSPITGVYHGPSWAETTLGNREAGLCGSKSARVPDQLFTLLELTTYNKRKS